MKLNIALSFRVIYFHFATRAQIVSLTNDGDLFKIYVFDQLGRFEMTWFAYKVKVIFNSRGHL